MQQPYFLNAAGNKKMKDGIMLWYADENPFIYSITGTNVTVHSTYNGEPVTQNYPSLTEAAIALKADPNTEVYIEGNVTSMINNSSEKRIVCHNTALTTLNCDSCPGLTSLDLSANTALTTLNCNSCNYIRTIEYTAQNQTIATKIAGLISAAFATDGNVYCKGTYSSTVQTAATSKGWTYHTLE